ncbi:MAG TPA: GFA family protein [Gammaproteobacteria bacterium]
MSELVTHKGSCHCKAVQYTVEAPAKLRVQDCNCSICSRCGYLHLIVPQSRFHLVQGGEYLTTYTFDTHEAKHLFCKVCGIKSFYIPRSNPEGISVNARCLESVTIESLQIELFDGKNWEQHAHELASLSHNDQD